MKTFSVLKPGMRVDILILSANPLEDIPNTREQDGKVEKGGHPSSRAVIARTVHSNGLVTNTITVTAFA